MNHVFVVGVITTHPLAANASHPEASALQQLHQSKACTLKAAQPFRLFDVS